MLASTLKAVIGILVLLGGWLLVQAAWRRVFPGLPPGEDVMAGRLGCHGCPCEDRCERSGDLLEPSTQPHSDQLHP